MRFETGLLTRLSNIIIVQVIFIFAATAMIVLYPGEDQTRNTDYLVLRQKFDQVGGSIASTYSSGAKKSADIPWAKVAVPSLNSIFSRGHLTDARLYVRGSDGHPVQMRASDTRQGTTDDGPSFEHGELIESATVDYALGLKDPVLIPISPLGHYSVYYYRFDLAESRPAVLVAIADHAYVFANRSHLAYLLLLLFLASALVSLLAVYLLNKRFRDPLRRLIHGFEKTGNGELYYMVNQGYDPERDRLTGAFNTMSQRLWDNHTELQKYNSSLEKANQMLRESQEHFKTLIDSSPVCIISTTTDGVITVFNHKAEQVFGMTESEICGSNVCDLFRNTASENDWRPEGAGAVNLELLCQRSDDTLFPGYVTATSVTGRNDEVVAYLFIIRDISESKSFQEMMIRLDRYYTRGEMAGDIAHEINNFLAILSGNIELMPLFLKKGDNEKISKKLELMKGTVDKIARFTDGLMDVNDGNVKFDKIDANQLVETVLAFLKPQNKFDDVEVETNLAHDLPLVEVDIGQIQQLVVNLVYNASEALAEKEGEKHIWITTQLMDQEGEPTLSLVVEDDGPGVLPEKESWLFKRRFTTKDTGHGIGLITCKKIIDWHNAGIAYSKTSGARFACVIPINHRETQAEATESSLSGRPPVSMAEA